ncbi:MAG: glutamate 5-kinase [Gammaproteobacteria bacterium]|nr:MAG: glutamate 5-kinase [Gammaproteobacteria bacterium]
MNRARLKNTKRWVVKVGSALLTADGAGLDEILVNSLVDQIAKLRELGVEVVMVSSGAVAEGMQRLGWEERPKELHELQAAAAVGQMGLVQAYESKFQNYGLHTAQILLTHDDLANRRRYLNARGTIRALLEHKVVPVVNENDTVVTDEIRFGDNDTLAAMVANLVEADVLVILTDQKGLFDKDPRKNSDAKLISEAKSGDSALIDMASGGGGKLGRGGMLTKVKAATKAANSGAATAIAYGRVSDILLQLFNGDDVGTLLIPHNEPLAARKQWLANHMQVRGSLVIDAGAVRVLKNSGKSLLSVGVIGVKGEFKRGDVVSCIDESGFEIARGLVNYPADEVAKITKKSSDMIEAILGYLAEEEIIHRDNMVLI